WALPSLGLFWGLKHKDRPFLLVNLALGLLTLATSKPYLERPRQPWDPMILGVVLAVTALGVRRWLARAPGRAAAGFPAERLGAGGDLVGGRGNASVLVKAPAAPQPDTWAGFQGGRSGGGGASGSF